MYERAIAVQILEGMLDSVRHQIQSPMTIAVRSFLIGSTLGQRDRDAAAMITDEMVSLASCVPGFGSLVDNQAYVDRVIKEILEFVHS